KREITVIKQVKNVNKEKFVSSQLIEAQISPELTLEMKEELIEILFQYREAFASDNEPLGAIKGHEVDIMLNVERPYPPLLRRPAYPASPRAREALENHINELMKLGVLRKVGHNEEVEVTTPVIITWHNDKSRMVGDFRALNTYTIPDRYPIPRIHETLTQLSKARFITSMDALKGFHQNVLTPHARKLLRIIAHCGIYEYLRMPFGIKNAPSHYQRMMNTIFPHELSEGWLIIYIDDIIICSETWQLHLERLSLVLRKILQVNMKISLKKFLAYKTSIHASTGKTPAMLEKGWDTKLPIHTLKKDMIDIHPAASSFKLFLNKVRHNANQSMNDAFEYAKQKRDKSHKTPEFKVGDLILASTLNFNNIKRPKKFKDSFAGPFIIKALNGTNAVHVALSGELENKHQTFPVSLVKHYTSSDKELFPLRNETALEVPHWIKVRRKRY
ncbi:hypothetical protein O181_110169, partial [Austropuccinia psidii MF-1]|nr:hypothetical protein [Austropuccinia psidii MF-1]